MRVARFCSTLALGLLLAASAAADELTWEQLDLSTLPRPVPPDLRVAAPEVIDHFARHGIRFEHHTRADGRISEYRVIQPPTPGFHVTVHLWTFPQQWTEDEIRDYLVGFPIPSYVHGRFVLWHPGGRDVDDDEMKPFEKLRARIVEIFQRLEPAP